MYIQKPRLKASFRALSTDVTVFSSEESLFHTGLGADEQKLR